MSIRYEYTGAATIGIDMTEGGAVLLSWDDQQVEIDGSLDQLVQFAADITAQVGMIVKEHS